MCHIQKNVFNLEKWVALKKCVTVRKVCQSSKKVPHLQKCVALKK